MKKTYAFLLVLFVMMLSVANADVTLPSDMTVIDAEAFKNTPIAGTLTIPEGVTTIGAEAFSGCDGLTELMLPDTVTRIESKAFAGCSELAGTVVLADNCTVAEDAFDGCDRLTVKRAGGATPAEYFKYTIEDGQVTITGFRGGPEFIDGLNNGELTDIVVPRVVEGYPVTTIGYGAFQFCGWVRSIKLLDNITDIRDYAFSGSIGLSSIILPDSLSSIGEWAFHACDELTSIYIPNSVEYIGSSAFSNCPIVIYGIAGSYAEVYANRMGIPFKVGTIDGVPSCPYETAQTHQPPYGQLQDVELVLYDDGRIRVNAAVCPGCGAQLMDYGFLPESIQTQFYFHPLAHYYDTSANGKEYVKNSDYKSVIVNEDLTVTGDIDLNGAPLIVNGILRVEGALSGVGKIQCAELIVESKGVLDASAATFIGADSEKELHVKTGGKMFINDRTNITCAGDLNMEGLLTVYRSGTSDETNEHKGTITLTKQNPKMIIDNKYAIVKLRVKKIVLSNTAPYWFSWGNPVFWVEANEVNAEEIMFGCEPSQEDAGKLAKKVEEWEEKQKNTNQKLSDKKEAADNALSDYNSPVNDLAEYLDKVDGEMTAKDDPLADFAVAGYMHPSLTLAGTNTEKEYRAAASALLSDAIRQEFLNGAGIQIPETGEVVINIIADEGTYEGSYAGEEWILNFRQMGAGVDKEGKMVTAVCYKADDDIDDKLTPRYVIVAASTTEAVGEVLEEMAKGAVKEVVQQLISLTEELFNATDGMDAIEELVVGMLNWEDLTNGITTLKDYKKQLTERIENKVFSEIRGEIGYKIDKVETAYYTLKDVYEEYKELMEELDDYKRFLNLSQTYLK